MQKFFPWSRIGIFRNESTRTDPLDPKLTFWCLSYYLGAFGTLWLPYNTQCKTGQTGAKVRATKSRWNFSNEHPRSTHWTLNSCFGVFHIIWVHLGLFGCLPILSAKRVKLMQKFVHEVALEFFATNAPDPPLWILNSCSGVFQTNFAAFGTICWFAKTRCKTGAKVRVTKSLRNFSQRMHPIHPIGP